MTGSSRFSDRELQRIRRAVLQAAREAAIFEQPSQPSLLPPHDLRAERIVASQLLTGRPAPSELPCAASDFFDPFCREVVAMIEALEDLGRLWGRVDLVLLGKLFERRQLPLERIAPMLVELADDVPVAYDLERHAEVVAELAARRETIRAMQQLDAAWRLGHAPEPGAVERLRDALRRWDERVPVP